MSIGLVSTAAPVFCDWFHPLFVDKVFLSEMHDQSCDERYCGHLTCLLINQSSHIFLPPIISLTCVICVHARWDLGCILRRPGFGSAARLQVQTTAVHLVVQAAHSWQGRSTDPIIFAGMQSPSVERILDTEWKGIHTLEVAVACCLLGFVPYTHSFSLSPSISFSASVVFTMFSRVHVHAHYATCAAKDFLQMATGSMVTLTNAFRKGVS